MHACMSFTSVVDDFWHSFGPKGAKMLKDDFHIFPGAPSGMFLVKKWAVSGAFVKTKGGFRWFQVLSTFY